MLRIDLACFLFLEVLISFELIWLQLASDLELSFFYLWCPLILHYCGILGKMFLVQKSNYVILWLLCIGIEGVFLGLLQCSNSELMYLQTLLLVQCYLYLDMQLYLKQSALLIYWSLPLQFCSLNPNQWRLLTLIIEYIVIFSFLLLLHKKRVNKVLIESHKINETSKQEVGLSAKQTVQKLMYKQSVNEALDDRSKIHSFDDINQLIDNREKDVMVPFLELKCENCSQNLINLLVDDNQHISSFKEFQSNLKVEIKMILAVLLSDMNCYYGYYSVQDVESKNFMNYKLNFIILSDNFIDYVVIHFEHVIKQTHYSKLFTITDNKTNNNNTEKNQSNKSTITHDSISSMLICDIFKSISHEFGTFLNCIITVSSEAQSKEEINAEVRQSFIEPIYINAKLLSYILQNIRDFNSILLKQFALRLEEFNPKDIVDEILYLQHYQKISRNNEIIVNCPSNLHIYNDSDRFRQVLYQLLSNSMRFTQNGKITVDIKPHRDKVHITVIDTGIGMNSVEQGKLLDLLKDSKKLLRVSHNSVGCGLGLSISNAIVTKMNGKDGIYFTSEQHNGSKFSFSIMNSCQLYTESVYAPSMSYVKVLNQTYYVEQQLKSEESLRGYHNSIFRDDVLDTMREKQMTYHTKRTDSKLFFIRSQKRHSEDESDSREEQHILIPSIQTNLKSQILKFSISSNCCSRIMIVDDEYFNIQSLQLILKKFHTLCDFAFNGEECIRKCLEKASNPCKLCQSNGYVIFFLDLNMPIMDGFTTVKSLKTLMKDHSIPKGICIANTGFSDLESKQKALSEGMDYYLTKPIEIRELESFLRLKFLR